MNKIGLARNAKEQELVNWIFTYFEDLRIQKEIRAGSNVTEKYFPSKSSDTGQDELVSIEKVWSSRPYDEKWLNVCVQGVLILVYPDGSGIPLSFTDIVRCKVLQAGKGSSLEIHSMTDGTWIDDFLVSLNNAWDVVWEDDQTAQNVISNELEPEKTITTEPEIPIGIRAKQYHVRVNTLERWDKEKVLREKEGLTQALISERLSIDVDTVKHDFRIMRIKGIYNPS